MHLVDGGDKVAFSVKYTKTFLDKIYITFVLRTISSFWILGNQPFFTRSSCSNISLMVQNERMQRRPKAHHGDVLHYQNIDAADAQWHHQLGAPNNIRLSQHRVKQADDEECADTYDKARQMIFVQEIHCCSLFLGANKVFLLDALFQEIKVSVAVTWESPASCCSTNPSNKINVLRSILGI